MLLDYLHSAKQDQLVTLDTTVTVSGLATVTVQAVAAKGTIGSGIGEAAVIGPVGSEAAGSRGRVLLTISLLQPISVNLGLVKLSLPVTIPLIVDIANGTATVSDVTCGPDIANTTDVAVSAQAGAVHFYVGTVDPDQFADLFTPLSPQAAQIVNAGLVQVNAQGEQDVAPTGAQTLHFSRSDIDAGTVQSVDGTSSIGNSLDQLGSSATVTVTNAPLGTGALIANLIKPQLSAVLSALEPELTQILASLGIRAGILDVRATAARCGKPALVI